MKWFRVEVSDEHGQIVAIESEMLAGRDIGDSERETIEKAIRHLSGFLGSPSHPQEKDAERYRWLRDESEHYDAGPGVRSPWPVYGINGTDAYPIFRDDLDAAIDRAIKETGER